MKEKVFNKDLPHYCEYCAHGSHSEFSNEILCKKRGITDRKDSCKSYTYDPLKREPGKIKIAENYTPEDFEL